MAAESSQYIIVRVTDPTKQADGFSSYIKYVHIPYSGMLSLSYVATKSLHPLTYLALITASSLLFEDTMILFGWLNSWQQPFLELLFPLYQKSKRLENSLQTSLSPGEDPWNVF